MRNYPAEAYIRHKEVLKNAEPSDIKRMAFVGDKLISAALTVRLSKYDLSTTQSCQIVDTCLSNKTFSTMCSFPIKDKNGNSLTREHTRGTYVEAAFYLDHEKFGFQYLVDNVINIGCSHDILLILGK